MRTRTHFLLPALFGALLVSHLSPSFAQAPAPAAAPAQAAAPAETAEKLLERVDKGNSSFKDAIFDFKMVIKESSGAREVEFTTKQKGSKRLVKFSKPADISGMGILVESADVVYALLPQFGNRIRRVATHQMGGNFMGSDMSSDDMAVANYSSLFTPKIVGNEHNQTVLELSANPGVKLTNPKLKMWIDPAKALIAKIEYYDASGKKTRTQIREDYRPDSPTHSSPFLMRFIDHVRNNHETELRLQKSQLDTGIGDDQFSQRALQKG